MSNFTFDEINLMCIYNTGTRAGLMQALTDMRGQLEPDEAELLELTDSALRKLGRITDEQFAAHIHRLRQINQVRHFKRLDIAVYCSGRGIFQFLCRRGNAENFR